MDEKEQDNVAAFDTLFTTNRIQILKTLLPCFERPLQKYLAIYIKYQELQYTVSYFKNHPYHICGSSARQNDIRQLLPSLLPYCTDSQKRMLQQIEQTLSSLESYQEIMEMVEMMQTMTEEPTSNAEAPANSSAALQMPDMELLMSMLNPKQQEMIELLKGGIRHGTAGMDEGPDSDGYRPS